MGNSGYNLSNAKQLRNSLNSMFFPIFAHLLLMKILLKINTLETLSNLGLQTLDFQAPAKGAP
jgi:hypothetical protein